MGLSGSFNCFAGCQVSGDSGELQLLAITSVPLQRRKENFLPILLENAVEHFKPAHTLCIVAKARLLC